MVSRGASRVLWYLLGACLVCCACTLIVILTCSCDDGITTRVGARLSLRDQVSTDEVRPFRPSTYLVIAIMIHANHSAERAVIRDTWLKLSSKGPSVFRHVFVMGTKGLLERTRLRVDEEQALHGDMMLIESLVDTYANLSRKTLLAMHAICNHFDFQFLLKVDSDSFVRVGALLKALKDIEHPRLYWGFLDGRAKPRRKGQWAEKDWILCDRYLPYQLGGGYVLSYKLANFISLNKDLFKLYRNEDVAMGAWLAGLDVKYVHDPRFDTEFRSRGCNNEYIITHKQSPDALEALYASMINNGRLCEREYRTRWSYVYDWAALPSECCMRYNGSNIP